LGPRRAFDPKSLAARAFAAIAREQLDIALSRQIMEFHKSRHLQLRHGRTISKYGDTYYRWCFADLITALAFVEQFGGALCETSA
jgi:hypothetical protein